MTRSLVIFCLFISSLGATNLVSDEVDMLYAIRDEIKMLCGRIEVLEHQLKKLQKAIKPQEPYTEPAQKSLSLAPNVSLGDSIPQVHTKAQKDHTQPDITEAKEELSAGKALMRAQTLIQEKNFDEAVALLTRAQDKELTPELAVQLHYWLGEIYFNQAQYDQAVQTFAKAASAVLELKSKNHLPAKGPEIFWKLSDCLAQSGQKKEALLTIETAEKSFKAIPPHILDRLHALKKRLSSAQ